MSITLRFLKTFVVLFLVIFGGCSKTPPPLPQSEADQKFVDILQNEFHYKPIVKSVGKTVWIYVPNDKEIFNYRASKNSEKNVNKSSKKFSVEYLDGKFEDNNFIINYDIIPAVGTPKDAGFSNGYTDNFNEEYRNVLGAITRVYLNTFKEIL